MNVILLLFLFRQYLKVGILLAFWGSQGRDREAGEFLWRRSALMETEAVAK